MRVPNPKDYNFVWLVNNQTYFITSFWLHREYLKRNFLNIGKVREFRTYIGKKEQKRLAKFGSFFIKKEFHSYKIKVGKKTKEVNLFFKKMIHKNLSLLSNNKLREDFLKTIKFVQSVWSLYFFTEFFLYDEIQKIVEKDKNFMNKVREIQKLKFNLRAVLNKTYFDRGSIFAKYLKEISQRTKVKNFDLFNYQEVADLLINRKPKLTGRKYFVLGKFNNWQPVFGREALKIINAFDRIISQEGKQREFKGQIANRGFYQGRVKIIPFDLKKDLAKDISQMKKGDILVTGSTGPEMILAFKKAGAIVTEEGGIASHAAIVSRELGIPCIIGTKIATQVLKDGDLVEVNANKGIVKKL